MSERPGVMFYFDKWGPLTRLPDEQLSSLVRAALLYGEYGEIPETSQWDVYMSITWDILRPLIDKDGEHYTEVIEQRRYAVYCREADRHGEKRLSFEEWRDNQPLSPDNGSYPNPNPTPNPTTSTTPNASPNESESESERGAGEAGERTLVLPTAQTQQEQEAEFNRARYAALSKLDNYK